MRMLCLGALTLVVAALHLAAGLALDVPSAPHWRNGTRVDTPLPSLKTPSRVFFLAPPKPPEANATSTQSAAPLAAATPHPRETPAPADVAKALPRRSASEFSDVSAASQHALSTPSAVPATERPDAAHARPRPLAPLPAAAYPSAPAPWGAPTAVGRGGKSARPPSPAPRSSRRSELLGEPWPVYPTRPPPSVQLHYRLQQGRTAAGGMEAGEADLIWASDGQTFSLQLVNKAEGRPLREWLSEGDFDPAGLAPRRLTQRDGGREKQAVSFDRLQSHVRFSSSSADLAFAPGVQDRWSWLVQLAAIAQAAVHPENASRAPARPPENSPVPGTEWHLQVAGLRGALERWTFRVEPLAVPVELEASTPQAGPLLYVVREPERPYDLRVEAWLASSLHHLPLGLRMSTPPGSWSFRLWLAAADPVSGPAARQEGWRAAKAP